MISPILLLLPLLSLTTAQLIPDVTLPNIFPDAPSATSLLGPRIPLHCLPGFLTVADTQFCCRRYNVACPDRPTPPTICLTNPQDAPAICCHFGIACPTQGASCAANTDCAPALGCVFQTLRPRSGTCERVDVFGLACTVAFCEGEDHGPCVLPGPLYTNCKIWLEFLQKVRPTPTIGPISVVSPEMIIAPSSIPDDIQETPQPSQDAQIFAQTSASFEPEFSAQPSEIPGLEEDHFPFPSLIISPSVEPEPSNPPAAIIQVEPPAPTKPEKETNETSTSTSCSTISRDVKQRCPSPLTCVIEDFGQPSNGIPNQGTCQSVSTQVAVCTVDLCSTYGAQHLCSLPFVFVGTVTTCGAWHKPSVAIPGPNCNIICVGVCVIGPGSGSFIASNGKLYCGLCEFRRDSCVSGFVFYGPGSRPRDPPPAVTPSTRPVDRACRGTIDEEDAAMCCREFSIGCIREGKACSSSGGTEKGHGCEIGETCVVAEFGNRNRGRCAELKQEVTACTVPFCSKIGREGVCREVETMEVTRCGVWARSSEVKGPDCAFTCSQICNIGPDAPVGSDGVTYCSECQLRAVSCQSRFAIFGPVNV